MPQQHMQSVRHAHNAQSRSSIYAFGHYAALHCTLLQRLCRTADVSCLHKQHVMQPNMYYTALNMQMAPLAVKYA